MKLQLTLKVSYAPNGETQAFLQDCLDFLVQKAIGDGMLTGDGPAEVEEYSYDIGPQKPPIDPIALAKLLFPDDIHEGDCPCCLCAEANNIWQARVEQVAQALIQVKS